MKGQTVIFALILFFASCAYGQKVELIQTAEGTSDRLSVKNPLYFSPFNTSYSGNAVFVNPTNKFQEIYGFGGAFTDAASIVWSSLPENVQNEILELYWGEKGLQYVVGRVPMNSCDFSLFSYNFDNVTDDYELLHFDHNVTHDQRTMIPFIKGALGTRAQWTNSSMKLFLTPWSPPAWMKIPVDGKQSMDGSAQPNGLEQVYFESWALYFSYFISAYKNSGINFWGLTPQNEPLNPAYYEACCYNGTYEANLIAEFLGPQIKQDHPGVLIMGYDHNRDQVYQFMSDIYNDPKANQYVAGTAFHWYGIPYYYALNQTHYLSPDKFMLGTEACACPGPANSKPTVAWPRAEAYAHDIIADLNFWAVGWTDWNLVLDNEGGPNHVQNYCDACIIGFPKNGSYSIQPCYYYMGQISKYIIPGSVRVETMNSIRLPNPGNPYLQDQSNVVMYSCENSAQQMWQMNGTEIKVKGTNFCLDLMNSDEDNGANVQVYTCGNSQPNQQWSIKGSQIVSALNGKCVDIMNLSTDNGANVQMWDCTGGINQQFDLLSDGTIVSKMNNKCITAGWSPFQAVSVIRPDGNIASVVLNETDQTIEFELVYLQNSVSTSIPPHAIQTYVWQQ